MFNALAVSLFIILGSFYALADETEPAPALNILPIDLSYQQETPDEQFERADANGDGKLDKCEFSNRDKWVAQNNEQQFKEFDTNADGFVSQEEQDAYIEKQVEEAERWLQESYNSTIQQFDTNGDQLLQQDELADLLKTWYSYKPGATFNFATFDTNGDKGLDAEELGEFEQNIPWDDLDLIDQEFQPMTI